MGLCLIVFDRELEEDEEEDPDELASCDVGHYSDFAYFRQTVSTHLDATAFPTLMLHSDCDGEWTLEEFPRLERELQEISKAFKRLPGRKHFWSIRAYGGISRPRAVAIRMFS